MAVNSSAAGLARALAAHRQRVEGQCVVCGAAIAGITRRRYCSGRCRQRAFVERRHRQGAIPPARQGIMAQSHVLTPADMERLDRTRARIMEGQRFADSSAGLVRIGRMEPTEV